jgi:hypothetical protein
MKTKVRKVKPECWINDTWLAPYCGYTVKLIECKSGKISMILNGSRYDNVEGKYTASNGWNYTIKKLLSRSLS